MLSYLVSLDMLVSGHLECEFSSAINQHKSCLFPVKGDQVDLGLIAQSKQILSFLSEVQPPLVAEISHLLKGCGKAT